MKFIKYVSFDFKQGLLRSKPLLLVPVVIALVTFLDFTAKAHRFLLDGMIKDSVSYGDYFFYMYGGMNKYIPAPGNAFRFPVVWVIIFLTVPFLLLNYPFRDMHGVGQQVLVRSGKRTFWWLSKCCWNFFGTILYHMLIQAVGIVLFLLFRMNVSNQLHMEFIKLAFQVGHDELRNPLQIPLIVLFLPTLVSVAINLLQMMLSLFLKPMFSFFVVAVLLLSSAYLLSPVLFANFAMVMRYSWRLKGGVSINVGYAVSSTLLLLAVLLGLVRFRFYDIFGSE